MNKKMLFGLVYVCAFLVVFQSVVFAEPALFFNSQPISISKYDPLETDADRDTKMQKMLESKKDPTTAALLSGIIPGVGHVYAGDGTRGAAVFGGALGSVLFSFMATALLSGVDNNFGRFCSIVMSVAPVAGYWAWSGTDAYYRTEMQNVSVDEKIKQFVNMGWTNYAYKL